MTPLRLDVLTLFPEIFAPAIGLSILGRAHERGVVTIAMHHLLDALPGAERADDRPYGGGPGMVLRPEPIAHIIDAILASAAPTERRLVVIPNPAGVPFRHADAVDLATFDRIIFVCGHYEGVDERIAEAYDAREYSLGDFVLTGGEIPTLAFLDAVVRQRAGTLSAASLEIESFTNDLLDAPVYTRPPSFRGIDVPAVLLSGDHAAIAAWRREESRARTRARRPDLGKRSE